MTEGSPSIDRLRFYRYHSENGVARLHVLAG
jgi:hypothetical protein